jgi:hypothetical protein
MRSQFCVGTGVKTASDNGWSQKFFRQEAKTNEKDMYGAFATRSG